MSASVASSSSEPFDVLPEQYEPSKTFRPNRSALVFVSAVAFVAGATPAVLLLRLPWLIPVLAVEAIVVAVLALRGFSASATQRPAVREFLLGGLASAFPGSILGMFAFVVYWLLYGVARLVDVVGLGEPSTRWVAAYPTAAVLVLFVPVYVVFSARTLASQLYPSTAGLRSAFYALLATQEWSRLVRRVFATFAGGIILIAFLDAVLTFENAALLAAQVIILFVTSAFWQAGRVGVRQDTSAAKAVGTLLEESGFLVTLTPRTGNEALDPLLVNVDLLARNSERALAIEVKVSPEHALVDWMEGSKLLTAASALESAGGELEVTTSVEPVLVLVGGNADASLESFARDVSMHIVTVPEPVAASLEAGDDAPLRDFARGEFKDVIWAPADAEEDHGTA